MTKRTWAVAIAFLCVATASACSGGGSDGGNDIPFVATDPASTSPTDQAIIAAQEKLRARPDDLNAQSDLAGAFLQKARETADPTLYEKAGQLLDQLERTTQPSVTLYVNQATLALAQHRFTDARELGTRAVELAPGNEAALGVLVDANNELGRYDDALAAGEEMVATRPNLASLSRASYARELRGDLDGAILAMSQAETSGSPVGGENIAYVQVQLGNLLVTKGDLAEAARTYARADQSFPGFPGAKIGQARILVAQERFEEAGDLLGEVMEVQPLAETAIIQGDAYAAAGRDDDAAEAYALVGAIAELYRDNGVNVDLELALHEADQEPGADAVARARDALEARPGIFGHDALAWNLFRAGELEEAVEESEAALVTGSRDPSLRFHAAAIAAADGDEAAARDHLEVVLGTNPRFSAHLLPEVEDLAEELGLPFPPVPTP